MITLISINVKITYKLILSDTRVHVQAKCFYILTPKRQLVQKFPRKENFNPDLNS